MLWIDYISDKFATDGLFELILDCLEKHGQDKRMFNLMTKCLSRCLQTGIITPI